jgi:hypothetical protein
LRELKTEPYEKGLLPMGSFEMNLTIGNFEGDLVSRTLNVIFGRKL